MCSENGMCIPMPYSENKIGWTIPSTEYNYHNTLKKLLIHYIKRKIAWFCDFCKGNNNLLRGQKERSDVQCGRKEHLPCVSITLLASTDHHFYGLHMKPRGWTVNPTMSNQGPL